MADGVAVGSGSVIVLGAGIAGLAAADWLTDAGMCVTVLEGSARAGGNHRSREIGAYTFDVGSIFYEERAKLFSLAPELREMCPIVESHQRRIAPDGSIMLYPIEPLELVRQPIAELARSAANLLFARAFVQRDGTLDAICRKRLGSRFYETTGLRSYITRFYHVAPEHIDEEFFFRRMSIIERSTRLEAIARGATKAILFSKPVNAQKRWPMRARPRSGFDPLFETIVNRLRSKGVQFRFGEEVKQLRREANLFHVQTTAGASIADAVVSTIPLDTLHSAMFGTGSGLQSLDMTTLFVSARSLKGGKANVLFNFHPQGRWKRITVYSRIYPDPACDREFFSVEITVPPGSQSDPEAAFEDFRAHLTGLGLAEDLKLEGEEVVKDCYPLYALGSRDRLERAIERVTAQGVVVAGRQGRFEYLPTSSQVIARVTQELNAAEMRPIDPRMAA